MRPKALVSTVSTGLKLVHPVLLWRSWGSFEGRGGFSERSSSLFCPEVKLLGECKVQEHVLVLWGCTLSVLHPEWACYTLSERVIPWVCYTLSECVIPWVCYTEWACYTLSVLHPEWVCYTLSVLHRVSMLYPECVSPREFTGRLAGTPSCGHSHAPVSRFLGKSIKTIYFTK